MPSELNWLCISAVSKIERDAYVRRKYDQTKKTCYDVYVLLLLKPNPSKSELKIKVRLIRIKFGVASS